LGESEVGNVNDIWMTKTTSGFGFINTGVAPSTPANRQGQIVGRITF